MRNLKLILAYDGADFAGWQVQPDRPTIQGSLASAIGRLTGENVLPQGSGRTDAGVHALAQVATFQTASPIPVESWVKALNHILPASIRVIEVAEEPADFHARKSARAKTYRYRIFREGICPPFLARYVWHYPFPLDESAMIAAASLMMGKHDFTSFAAVDPERTGQVDPCGELNHGGHPSTSLRAGSGARRKAGDTESGVAASRENEQDVSVSNVRTVYSSYWLRQGDEFVYTICGNGFLHHMVRNLVGTFVLVGKGTVTGSDFGRILAARDRSAAGPTAPASGLYLLSVEY